MIKNLLLLFSLLLCVLATKAQDRLELSDSEMGEAFTEEELKVIDNKERGTVLKRRDIETGIFLKNYNTYDDKNRTSFLYHLNNDISSPTDLTTLEFNYAHRFELAWLELFAFRTSGKFREITDNNPGDFGTSFDLEDTDETLFAFGAAISYRSRWIQDLVNSDKMFTTTSAGIGYYSFDENFTGQSYGGPGLKTDFGLHRRSSRSVHYGVRMSYHLASVKRAEEVEGETSSQRALTLSWLTFGFDLSFYF
ncbi:MAG: hypothetical protein VXV96_02270 [Bdellovibrionota bacterium]|nr:hypothetical protein [Bdellovibrionota bacterium]